VVLPKGERNAVLKDAFRRCDIGDECTFGRVLAATGSDRWTESPMVGDRDIQSAMASIRKLKLAPFLHEDQKGFGAIAVYEVDGETKTVACFHTLEIANDTHGYVEVLFRGSGSNIEREDSLHYFFDVAGIEFATPKVLTAIGMVCAYFVASLTFISTYVFGARVRRRRRG